MLGTKGTNKIVIARNVFKEKEYIDIRVFFCMEENPHHWIPTKKGVSLPADKLQELMDILAQVQ
jgi:hypothetical protein